MKQIDQKILQFVLKKDSKSFRAIERYLAYLCKTIYWRYFKKANHYESQEAFSHVVMILYKANSITSTNLSGYLYSTIKVFYFDKNKKIEYRDDMVSLERSHHTSDDSDFEDFKIELVSQLKNRLHDSKDVNALVVLSALIKLIVTEEDYDSRFASLYLMRVTGKKFHTIFRTLHRLKIMLPLTNEKTFSKIFQFYIDKYGAPVSEGKVIEDWERRAIEEFGDHHVRSRGEGFEERNCRQSIKGSKKVSVNERVKWLTESSSLSLDEMYVQYSKKFKLSYRSFNADRMRLKKAVI